MRKEVLESYGAPVETKEPSTSHVVPKKIYLAEIDNEEPKSAKGSYVLTVTDSNEIKKVWSVSYFLMLSKFEIFLGSQS